MQQLTAGITKAGTGLDGNLEACVGEPTQHVGNQRHAVLGWLDFSYYSDLHQGGRYQPVSKPRR